MNKNIFIVLAISMMAISFGAKAEEKWLILGNTGWVTGDDRLALEMPSVAQTHLTITSDTTGDQQWISQDIPFMWRGEIKGIYLCYQAPYEGTYISQVRLTEYMLPGEAIVRHDDQADLISANGDCYYSIVKDYLPAGSVNLGLRLNFANPGDIIEIGALGIIIDK
ncbi:MAG: hypothetical protein H6937_10570 [Burkholderiales bacterium]|nr:hypothetical protein [Burkholderiales bacterium]MDR4518635.1 hypothetical protein [Nitrosomonas sp.]